MSGTHSRRGRAVLAAVAAAVLGFASSSDAGAREPAPLPDPGLPLFEVEDAFADASREPSLFVLPLRGAWSDRVYCADFGVPAFWSGREVYLRLGASATAVDAFLNGSAIGSLSPAVAPAAVDVTPFLNDGTNVLSLSAHRTVATGADALPKEVLIYSTPPIELVGLGFRTRVAPDQTDAEGEIAMRVVKHRRPLSYRSVKRKAWVAARLFDHERREVAKAEPQQIDLAPDGVSTNAAVTMVIADPRLWCEEDQYLYTLVVQVDADIRCARVAVRESFRSEDR